MTATTDGAFLSIQRGQCGAVYGTAMDLAILVMGLTRDGLTVRYLPIRIAPEAATKAQEKLAEREGARRPEREAEERRRERDQTENGRTALSAKVALGW